MTTSDHHFVVCLWSERGLKCPELTALDVDPAGAGDAWLGYVRGWVVWNHVRTITPLTAGVSFVLALRAG